MDKKQDSTKSYDSCVLKKIDKSQVEISLSIPYSVWGKYRAQAIKEIGKNLTVPGFRKGMVPENILINKVGEMAILEEMAEMAISPVYVDVIVDNKIDAIGKPNIQVTKIAKDNPLEIKITTAVVPNFELPDYKKISSEIIKSSPEEEGVSEKEIDEAILNIRKANVSHEGHDHEKMTTEEHDKVIMENLPELNDDFVKKIGDFQDVQDFKNKLSQILLEEKKSKAKDKLRVKIADAIAHKTNIEIPEIMIESELDRTEVQFKADIGRMGVNMEDYLKHGKKTLGEIRQEWKPYAEKKAKLQLILNKIASVENIKPEQKEIDEEVNHIVEHYKDADRERATVYAETVLTNEKVFQWLEKKE